LNFKTGSVQSFSSRWTLEDKAGSGASAAANGSKNLGQRNNYCYLHSNCIICNKQLIMSFNIPNSVLKKAEITGSELLIEVSVYLYDKERLSFGQAKSLAQMNQLEFQKELAKRDVYIKYNSDDLN